MDPSYLLSRLRKGLGNNLSGIGQMVGMGAATFSPLTAPYVMPQVQKAITDAGMAEGQAIRQDPLREAYIASRAVSDKAHSLVTDPGDLVQTIGENIGPGELASLGKAGLIIGARGMRNLKPLVADEGDRLLAASKILRAQGKTTHNSDEMQYIASRLRDLDAHIGTDRKLRYEIPTNNWGVDYETLRLLRSGKQNQLSLKDVLDAPEFFKAFPNDATDVHLGEGLGGHYNPNTKSIMVGERHRGSEFADVLQHEMQHAAQEYEGREPSYLGANADYLKQTLGNIDGMRAYLSNLGEVEARVSALRRSMTPEQMRQYPFNKHVYDVRSKLASDPDQIGNIWSSKFMDDLRNGTFR